MKTYKEINDELHVCDEIKKNTIHQMINYKVHHRKPYLVVGVMCILLIVCGIEFQYAGNHSTKQKKAIAFQMDDYIQTQEMKNAKTGGDDAFSKEKLSDTSSSDMRDFDLETYGFKKVVRGRDIVVPKGFELREMLLEKQMSDGETSPCIQYCFQKGELSFTVLIEKQNSGSMSSYEKAGSKDYKGYTLCIQRMDLNNGKLRYQATASKDKIGYTISAVVKKEELFQNFLLSILR